MANDPTRNERQRLYRARRKAEAEGLVEVTVGGDRFWVSPKRAAEVRQWLAEEAEKGQATPGQRPNGA